MKPHKEEDEISVQTLMKRGPKNSLEFRPGKAALLAVCGSLLIATSYVPFFQEWDLVIHVCRDIGIAVVVAICIFYLVDSVATPIRERNSQEMVQNINNNLFYNIYRRYIPEDVFNEVERCLFNKGIIRTNYRIEYVFGDLAGAGTEGYYLCELTSRYNMKNISGGTIEEQVTMALELPIDERLRSYVEVLSVKIGDQYLTADDIKKGTRNNHNQVRFSHNVRLDGPSKAVEVKGRLVKEYTDMEVWTTSYPTDGLTLTIFAPPTCQVEAHANHSRGDSMEAGSSPISKDSQKHEFSLQYGFLPYQSIVFWWSPLERDQAHVVEQIPEQNGKNT